MRQFFYGIVIGLSFALLFLKPELVTPATAASEPTTRVVTDQASGTIRFVIGNMEVGRFDAAGLHIRKGVEYGGALTDTGEANYVGAHAQ